jgi:hypothetical protein
LQRRVSGFIEIKAGSHKTPARRPQARKKSVPEENGKRREEEFCRNLEKKTEREEDNKFKPADSPHFQTAADRNPAPDLQGRCRAAVHRLRTSKRDGQQRLCRRLYGCGVKRGCLPVAF